MPGVCTRFQWIAPGRKLAFSKSFEILRATPKSLNCYEVPSHGRSRKEATTHLHLLDPVGGMYSIILLLISEGSSRERSESNDDQQGWIGRIIRSSRVFRRMSGTSSPAVSPQKDIEWKPRLSKKKAKTLESNSVDIPQTEQEPVTFGPGSEMLPRRGTIASNNSPMSPGVIFLCGYCTDSLILAHYFMCRAWMKACGLCKILSIKV